MMWLEDSFFMALRISIRKSGLSVCQHLFILSLSSGCSQSIRVFHSFPAHSVCETLILLQAHSFELSLLLPASFSLFAVFLARTHSAVVSCTALTTRMPAQTNLLDIVHWSLASVTVLLMLLLIWWHVVRAKKWVCCVPPLANADDQLPWWCFAPFRVLFVLRVTATSCGGMPLCNAQCVLVCCIRQCV